MLIKHSYLKNTTITTHLGKLRLDENGTTEVEDESLLGHPDFTQVVTDNPVKAPLEENKVDTTNQEEHNINEPEIFETEQKDEQGNIGSETLGKKEEAKESQVKTTTRRSSARSNKNVQ